ncbi:MAG: hypothetical protein ACKOAD_00865 [Gammaproteobacteria bacterium]
MELYSSEGQVGIHAICIALTDHYVDDVVKVNRTVTPMEIELFKFIEFMREKFHDEPEETEEGMFDNAVCTCFLENLLNMASHSHAELRYERFIPLLGPLSLKYCKAWDHFTDVRSPGLWEDAEWEAAQNDPSASFS